MKEDAVTKVVRALRQQLEEYRSRKPNLSVRAIAKNSNVNRYFIHKILDEDPENVGSLDFSQVLLLSKFLTNAKSIKDTIDQSSEEIKNLLKSTFQVDYNSDFASKRYSAFSDADLDDFDIFIILLLASCPGTTLSLLKRSLCEKAHEKIYFLRKRGIIKIEAEVVSIADGSIFHIPTEIRVKHLPEVIKRYFSSCNFGKQRCYHGLYYQNINRAALKKIHAMHEEFMSKVNHVLDHEDSAGDIPVFTAVCMDSFVSWDDVNLAENVGEKHAKV